MKYKVFVVSLLREKLSQKNNWKSSKVSRTFKDFWHLVDINILMITDQMSNRRFSS